MTGEDWDGVDAPGPRRGPGVWTLLPVVAVLVAVVMVATILDGVDHVSSDRRPQQAPAVSAATTPGSLPVATDPPAKEPSLAIDDPAEPLYITLGETGGPGEGVVAFRVKVCVSPRSAAVASNSVKVSLFSWRLVSASGSVAVAIGDTTYLPQFPTLVWLGRGECVGGFVAFRSVGVERPYLLEYHDNRFDWSWYLG